MEPIIADQLVLPVAPPEFFRFNDFYPGDNLLVVEHLKALVEQQDNISSLCYISGKPGTGKTHLLHATAEYAGSQNIPVIYLDLSELMTLSQECLLGLEQYRIVCLDNIQVIEGDYAWQQAVFDLINRILESEHAVLFSAEKLPKLLNIELKDLVSRLDWGVSFTLEALSDEQLIEALIIKAGTKGLKLPKEVASFLIKHFRRDMKSLVEVLVRLDERSLQTQRNLTIPFVKAELQL